MTFTWDIIDISGYSTGDGVNNTGIQIDQPLRISVSGLKYDSSGIDNNHLAFITGIGRTASGDLLTPVSGVFIWNPDNTQWEVTISVSNTNDFSKHTTGFADWEWNSGSINASTGIECEVSGIETYRNAGGSAWDAISSTDGFVNNADTQHTHAGLGGSTTGAFQLDELSDVAQDGVLGYTDGKILRADGNSYEESYLYIADIPKLADLSGDYLDTSGVLNDLSGDYLDTSGLVNDLSGDFSDLSGDYLDTSGVLHDLNEDYLITSGDYVTVSGVVSDLSGVIHETGVDWLAELKDVDEHLSGIIISLDDSGSSFPTSSGGQLFWDTESEALYRWRSGAEAWIQVGGGGATGIQGYVDLSGDFVDLYEDYVTTSGDFSDLSGDFADLEPYYNTGETYHTGELYTDTYVEDSFSPTGHTHTGYETVSGDYKEFTGSYAILSGDLVDLILDFGDLSGDFSDLSGDHMSISGDFSEVSGDFSSLSGDVYDYKDLSGDFSDLSGDYITTSGTVDDYKTVSGIIADMSGDYTLHDHDNLYYRKSILYHTGETYHIGEVYHTGYIQEHYTSGDVFKDLSGDYLELSGDFIEVSGLFTGHTHELDELTDTFISAPISGDALRWNGTHWVDSTIQDLPDYNDLSGDFLDLSGDFVDLSGDFADLEPYYNTGETYHTGELYTDTYIENSFSPTGHTHTGYETVSGDWINASGDLSDYKIVSGDFADLEPYYNTGETYHTGELYTDTYIENSFSITGHGHTGYESERGEFVITPQFISPGDTNVDISLGEDYFTHGRMKIYIPRQVSNTTKRGMNLNIDFTLIDTGAYSDASEYRTESFRGYGGLQYYWTHYKQLAWYQSDDGKISQNQYSLNGRPVYVKTCYISGSNIKLVLTNTNGSLDASIEFKGNYAVYA